MPVSRMRMRPWLEKMIESNTVSGLNWVDKDQKMFCIPWKLAARHGWEMDKDASLFKMWAIHTGKYTDGQNTEPKTWKANFRCAMNSLPDIEEVKDKSIHKGQQAVRVFRMLPVTPKSGPNVQPTNQPSNQPNVQPDKRPTRQTSNQTNVQPAKRPTSQTSNQPNVQPAKRLTSQTSNQPNVQPNKRPTNQPNVAPKLHTHRYQRY